MNTGSLRARVTFVTMSMLLVVLAIFIVSVTFAYRSSLESELHDHLAAAARAVELGGSGAAAKELIGGLALEGIDTTIDAAPRPAPSKIGAPDESALIKTGATFGSAGPLQVVEQNLPDGTRVTFSASSDRITDAVNRLLVVEILIAAVAAMLALLILSRVTTAALRPLSRIIQTASRIASGDAQLRLRPTRSDTELGELAIAFDTMVDALDEVLIDPGHASSS